MNKDVSYIAPTRASNLWYWKKAFIFQAKNLRWLCALFLVFLLLLSCVYNRSRANSPLKLENIPVLSLDSVERLLVVAPHPDDEALGAGGLIQTAVDRGVQVRVVFFTNGDGQPFAPLAMGHRNHYRPETFISMGQQRQIEAYNAVQVLGVPVEQADFLGYPDRGLMTLWVENWNNKCQYRALLTRSTFNPYPISYRKSATYCGGDVLQDIHAILQDFRPELIVIPHPEDEHLDHQATANFTRLALAELEEQNQAYKPRLVGYLVHYGYFPSTNNRRIRESLLPPVPLSGSEADWLRLDLSAGQRQTKLQAIRSHVSQIRQMRSFLESFARSNELFVALPEENLSLLAYNNLPVENTQPEEISIQDAGQESLRRLLVSGADLVGWRITRIGNVLLLTANTKGQLVSGLKYQVLIKTPDGETHIYSLKSSQVARIFRGFTAKIDLNDLGNPKRLGIAAEVRWGTVLDRTGWSFIELNDLADKPGNDVELIGGDEMLEMGGTMGVDELSYDDLILIGE